MVSNFDGAHMFPPLPIPKARRKPIAVKQTTWCVHEQELALGVMRFFCGYMLRECLSGVGCVSVLCVSHIRVSVTPVGVPEIVMPT